MSPKNLQLAYGSSDPYRGWVNILSLLADHPTLLLAGFGLGLSLMVVIGAQNAYVMRQGARREHLMAVLSVCVLSDITLILAGVAGLGALIDHAAWVIVVMRWFGVLFLAGYGLFAFKRAWRPVGAALTVEADADGDAAATPTHGGAATTTLIKPKTDARQLLPVVLTAIALTWLNPHVYLDTVVLLGSVANTHGADGRWAFAIGACLASITWFTVLGCGSRLLSRWLSSPLAWRILDSIIAVIMLTLAASLALSS